MNRLLNANALIVLIAILLGIGAVAARADENARFDELSKQFLDGYLKWRPGAAVHAAGWVHQGAPGPVPAEGHLTAVKVADTG